MTETTTPPTKSSLPVRAVERAAALLSGRTLSRRRFLFRAAVVGSALATNPLGYILRPGTAYASVCGSGNTCRAGWSVFCCTINNGANTCPESSYVAGWWKVDDSAFCLGAPRYYIDCNRRPRASCECRCNGSGCDRRRTCCNVFRYGQCNTHVAGVTEVVCRIVTCTPPWQWDPACGRTARTSNETRTHSAPCLPGPDPSRIDLKYQDLGLVGSALGAPVSRERAGAGDGRKRIYERGLILWHPALGAHELHGSVARRYRQHGAEGGVLGYPRTDIRAVAGSGRFAWFQRGSIYGHPATGTWVVTRRTDRRYRALGGPASDLGFPTTSSVPGDRGNVTNFQGGAIYVSPKTDAIEITGPILSLYRARNGPDSSGLGFPTSPRRTLDDGTVRQRFVNGVIAGPRATAVFAIRGPIFKRWWRDGAHTGPWGHPTAHTERVAGTDGEQSQFRRAAAYWSGPTGVHWLNGPILRRYRRAGGPAGWLGFPTADQSTDPATGETVVTFQHGEIRHDPATGLIQVKRVNSAR